MMAGITVKQVKIKNGVIKNICNGSDYSLTFWGPAKKAVNRSRKQVGSREDVRNQHDMVAFRAGKPLATSIPENMCMNDTPCNK